MLPAGGRIPQLLQLPPQACPQKTTLNYHHDPCQRHKYIQTSLQTINRYSHSQSSYPRESSAHSNKPNSFDDAEFSSYYKDMHWQASVVECAHSGVQLKERSIMYKEISTCKSLCQDMISVVNIHTSVDNSSGFKVE
jgi:hypothetical protein